MSGNKENEYFSDGLAEEILNALAKTPGLKVIARTSSFAFRGKEQDITKIAEMLRVKTILEGSVRTSGNRLRVTAQLVSAADGSHLWSERYDRKLTEVFEIQDDISQNIANALRVKLLAPRRPTQNVEAYLNYLKGIFFFERAFTPQTLEKARIHFQQALAIDPNCALAHAGLAGCYCALPLLGLRASAEVLPLAKSCVEKALALDPALSDIHAVRGVVSVLVNYDWKAAEGDFRIALALEPVIPIVRFQFAYYFLMPRRRFKEAQEQIRRALDADPLAVLYHYALTYLLYIMGDLDGAIKHAAGALEMDAAFWPLHAVIGLSQLDKGLVLDSVASFQRAVELAPWSPVLAPWLAGVYTRAGRHSEAGQLLRDALSSPLGMANYYAIVGEADQMFEYLERCWKEREAMLALHIVTPRFNPYRSDPRFHALLHKMHLA
jgi:serine/threonine-protein kinase